MSATLVSNSASNLHLPPDQHGSVGVIAVVCRNFNLIAPSLERETACASAPRAFFSRPCVN